MNASNETMNCEEYREAIAADPRASSEATDGHVALCESCAAFTADMRALDQRVARALEIEVPAFNMPDLPVIDGDNVSALPVAKRSLLSRPTWLAMAASFALAAIVGIQIFGTIPGGEASLSEQILAHLDHEPGALRVTNVSVSNEQFDRVVNPSVSSMDRNIGLISYAQSCIINGKSVPHLVMQGEKGPITLLLMPDEKVSAATKIDGESVNGVILPVGSGSIAIIGRSDEALDEIEQRVIDSVEWRL